MPYRTFALLLSWLFLSCGSCAGRKPNAAPDPARDAAAAPERPPEPPKPNIEAKDLPKTVVTVQGSWVEEDVMKDDTGSWRCSGVIREESAGSLVIVTSRQCLGLEGLSRSETASGAIDVKSWRIQAVTHNGRELEVTDLDVQTDLDLAVLRTRPAALLADVDFRSAPFGRDPVSPGDSIICAHAPDAPGKSGVLTFGRIGALQDNGRILQHDAPSPTGNGGDPLFAARGIDHFWVGVNSPQRKGQILREAVSVREIGAGPRITVTASPDGACKLLRLLFQAKCDVAK